MFTEVSEYLTQSLIENCFIKREDSDIYRYGIQQGLFLILNLVTTLVLGIVFGMVWQIVLFMGAYIPLRHFAGGYHSRTSQRCYVFSIVLMTVVLLAMKYISLTYFVYGILLFISGIVILILTPVEERNKLLDDKERKVFRKRAYVIWIFELLLSVIAWFLHWRSFAICIMWVLVIMMFMLMLGKLKNIAYTKKCKSF